MAAIGARYSILDPMEFDSDGLMPVVVQDDLTGEVRMLAYADKSAIDHTRKVGRATFFSRSRKTQWVKGETSGNYVDVREVRFDCDEDAALYLGQPHGPTCHEGTPSCFKGARAPFLLRLEDALEARKHSSAEKSYTKSLYEGGALRIGEKLREEADELARAVDGEADSRVVSEAADVVYHLMVALRHRGITVASVLGELDQRFGESGLAEKAKR
jgi:phosphoribosyl-AMP cyclohydrolase / phosphoribosyl-ATP pyrophosphohydrolase